MSEPSCDSPRTPALSSLASSAINLSLKKRSVDCEPENNQPAAANCWEEGERVRKTTCYGCQSPILDEYIMYLVGQTWHSRCLRCSACGVILSVTCYYHSGSFYCHQHWKEVKDTVTYCARCKLEISELELIHKSMRGVYHRRCFYCDVCHVQLKDGDSYYALRDSSALMCKLDFETASGKASYTHNSCKRPRTSIAQAQLEILKKAFEETSKPARHVREQISKETGLDKRVVQVWFQNRRAKEKRSSKDRLSDSEGGSYENSMDQVVFSQNMPPPVPSWPPLFLPISADLPLNSAADLHLGNHGNCLQCISSQHMNFLAAGLPAYDN